MSPRAEYERRATRHRDAIAGIERRWRAVAPIRVLGFLAAVVGLIVYFRGMEWGSTPFAAGLAAFAIAVAVHGRHAKRRREYERAAAWYDRAVARLDGDWAGSGNADGAEYRDPEHPYSGELDLFGPGSLYEWLNHAATRAGRDRLASWLAEPADAEVVQRRQAAVAQLRDDLEAREAMVLRAPRKIASPRALASWIRLEGKGSLVFKRLVAALASAAVVSTLWLWLDGTMSGVPLMGAAIAAFAVSRWAGRSLAPTLEPLDDLSAELRAGEGLLRILENCTPRDELTASLAERVRGARAPSVRIRSLRLHIDMLESAHNPIFMPIAAILLWHVQWGLAIEAWRRRWALAIEDALDALAEYEALQSLARAAYEHPDDVAPIIDPAADAIVGEGVAHPLLPDDVGVRNDLRLDDANALYVVSGSNMSGKSTWLRAIGVNLVLARAGGLVRARSLTMPDVALACSIHAGDSLLGGESRFAAELHRLRIVLAQAQASDRLVFLLDELFHGTHSHDRRAGARAFLARLVADGHWGLVTTHDLALTEMDEDALRDKSHNVHFADEVEGDRAVFDYRVREGVVQETNALRLMRAQGLIEDDATDKS